MTAWKVYIRLLNIPKDCHDHSAGGSTEAFWHTGGIAWIVVAWDFAFDIPGKPENAYRGQGAPRSAVRGLSSRFVFDPCLFDFQYATDLANLGPVAFANCHTFHRNTHASLSLNSVHVEP